MILALRRKQLMTILWVLSALLAGGAFWLGRVDKPLTATLSPRVGFSFSGAFTVHRTAPYRIHIRYRRALSRDQIMALVGAQSWVRVGVTQGGRDVALRQLFPAPSPVPSVSQPFGDTSLSRKWQDTARFGSSENRVFEDLAIFDATAGSRYAIRCAVLRTIKELEVTEPKLAIELDPLTAETNYSLGALFLVLSLASTMCALIATLRSGKADGS